MTTPSSVTIQTLFEDDLHEEGRRLHRAILSPVLGRETGSVVAPGMFRRPASYQFDDMVEVAGKAYWFEYKTDKWAYTTGNIVLEIVPRVMDDHFPAELDAIGRRIRVGTGGHEKVLDFAAMVNASRPLWAKASRHLSEVQEDGLFSYLVLLDEKGTSLDDVWRLLLFKFPDVAVLLRKSIRKMDVCVTRTRGRNGSWHTISLLFPFKSLDVPFLYYDRDGNPPFG